MKTRPCPWIIVLAAALSWRASAQDLEVGRRASPAPNEFQAADFAGSPGTDAPPTNSGAESPSIKPTDPQADSGPGGESAVLSPTAVRSDRAIESDSVRTEAAPTADSRVLRRSRSAGRTDESASAAASGNRLSSWKSWSQTGLALAAIVATILLLGWGYRNLTGGRAVLRPRRHGLIEVMSRASLSPRQSLALVRIGPRAVLIAYGADRTTALDVIDDAGLVAQLAGETAMGAPDSATTEFRAALAAQDRTYAAPVDSAAESVGSGSSRPGSDDLQTAKRRLAEVLDGIRGRPRTR